MILGAILGAILVAILVAITVAKRFTEAILSAREPEEPEAMLVAMLVAILGAITVAITVAKRFTEAIFDWKRSLPVAFWSGATNRHQLIFLK